MIDEYGLSNVIEIQPQVSQVKALEVVKRSHLALLIAPKQPYQIPAKAFEYIGTGTPILALTEEGATASLINATSTGIAVNPSDIQSIKKYLFKSIMGNGHGKEEKITEIVKAYDRTKIIEMLSHRMDKLVDGSIKPSPIVF